MKTLTRLSFAVLALACVAAHALAQTPARTEPEWVVVSPSGEGFEARMPKQPIPVGQRVSANGLSADGLRYDAAADERTIFIVWSMKGSSASGPLGNVGDTNAFSPDGAAYLDAIDELAWELLVAPEIERLAREKVSPRRLAELEIGMVYGGEVGLSGVHARRYSVSLEKVRGLVYVCAEGERVYVVAALSADEKEPRLKTVLRLVQAQVCGGPALRGRHQQRAQLRRRQRHGDGQWRQRRRRGSRRRARRLQQALQARGSVEEGDHHREARAGIHRTGAQI